MWRYGYARLSRDREAADDLVSETFLAAIRAIGSFDPRQGTVYGWLLGIARNKLHDHFRRAQRASEREPSVADVVADASSISPDMELLAAETRDAVLRALDNLNDDERFAIEWKYVESLSVREIAERLGARKRRSRRFSTARGTRSASPTPGSKREAVSVFSPRPRSSGRGAGGEGSLDRICSHQLPSPLCHEDRRADGAFATEPPNGSPGFRRASLRSVRPTELRNDRPSRSKSCRPTSTNLTTT